MAKYYRKAIECPKCKDIYKNAKDIIIIYDEGECIHCLDEKLQRTGTRMYNLFTTYKHYGFNKWINKGMNKL